MKYNTIHNRYELPLGLYFEIKKDVVHNTIICRSNIPNISYKTLKANNILDALIEIIDIIAGNLKGIFDNVQIVEQLQQFIETNNIKEINLNKNEK